LSQTNFEKLRVYQLAELLSDRVWKIVVRWDFFAKITIGKQMVNAADGVGSNIAEGTGRASSRDNLRFIKIARGSLYETKHWLRRAYKRNLLTPDEVSDLKPIISELVPKLNAYIRSVKQREENGTKSKVQSAEHSTPDVTTKRDHKNLR
jgi:four helix bundle protein